DGQLEALKTLLEENERVERHGLYESEMERAKKDLLARYEKSYKDRDKNESSRLVGEYIRNFFEQDTMRGIEWEYNFVKAQVPTIKVEEANKLISGYLNDQSRVIIITGPEKEGVKQVTEQEVKTSLANVNKAEIAPYEEKEIAESLITKPI